MSNLKYSAKDVMKVWKAISKWIENNITQDKGVLMKGIGYFTLAQWDLNVGKGYPQLVRKPVFIIDEKLAKDYNLKRRRDFNTGKIRERYFNILAVAQDSQIEIDMINHCFKDVVTAFRRLLYEEKNCELPFPNIGKLQVKNKIVTMKFYQEFLERQNTFLKNRTEEEKKKFQAENYNPDWDADQFKKRPCSAMSTISRPASSLSQYRPGTGYEGVLPSSRPSSSMSVQCHDRSRPQSRSSVLCDEDQYRPTSRSSARSCESIRPRSRSSVQRRPTSSMSVQCHDRSRPQSRSSIRCDDNRSRPTSRSSIQCRSTSSVSVQNDEQTSKPESRSSNIVKCDNPSRPTSELSVRSRPGSRMSTRCDEQTTRPRSNSSTERRDQTSKPKECEVKHNNVDENIKLMTGSDYNKNLCCLCNVRKVRIERIDKIKPDVYSTENKDYFMKGDNPLSGLSKSEIFNKRKSQLKEISNYNYVTAKKLLDAINDEKNKKLQEMNNKDNILNMRPSTNTKGFEKKKKLKDSLLNQIKCNTIKKEAEKFASLKSEQLMQKELLKSLHDERMKNIEAKNRSKENYLILLNKHIADKHKIDEKKKKENEGTQTFNNTILSNNEVQPQISETKCFYKNREIADYQLKQQMAYNQKCLEEIEKNKDFERNLLNQIKKEDEEMKRKILQKKLNQKKFLAEDLNKLLCDVEAERRKNEIPGAYAMSFPLKKLGERCRICKKDKINFPVDKISDNPC